MLFEKSPEVIDELDLRKIYSPKYGGYYYGVPMSQQHRPICASYDCNRWVTMINSKCKDGLCRTLTPVAASQPFSALEETDTIASGSPEIYTEPIWVADEFILDLNQPLDPLSPVPLVVNEPYIVVPPGVDRTRFVFRV